MRTFVLRARRAPVSAARFRASVGSDAHVEVIAHVLMNALFLARSHYEDVRVHIVLESSADFSRTVTISAADLKSTGGFHESAMIELVADALAGARSLAKGEGVATANGVAVRALSFEALVRELATSQPLFLLDRRGEDIRDVAFTDDPCFVLTDHLAMPKKTLNTLERLAAGRVSVGPRTLFASQCVALIQNELDRRAG